MKRFLTALLALILTILPAAAAEAPSADVQAMLPALDSVLRASLVLERDYEPGDCAFFWTALGLMAANWCQEDPQCEVVGEELRVPRLKMQELATAVFACDSELLDLPNGRFFVRYDEAWDAYFVELKDSDDAHTRILTARVQPNDTIDVEVEMTSENLSTPLTLKASLSRNSAAGADADPTYQYRITHSTVTPDVSERRKVLESSEAPVEEVRFDSTSGYALWIPDSNYRTVVSGEGESIIPTQTEDEREVALEIAQQSMDEPLQTPLSSAPALSDVHTESLANGWTLRWTETERGGITQRQYTIEGAEGCWNATLTCPTEWMDSYGTRLDEILHTMEPVA